MAALSWIIVGNTALVLTTEMRDIVLLEIPFTNRTIQLPDWMWGLYPLLAAGVFTLTAAILWTLFFLKRRRIHR